MDQQERDEVYERIPWETLEKKSGDKNWIVYAVAGAVVVGALAYSFTRNQSPVPADPAAAPVGTVPATTVIANTGSPPSTVASPIVVAEADLFAVDPERLLDSVAAHAELFAVEYISVDGSDPATIQKLLPEGMPAPVAPEGTQVYVDWARIASMVETAPGRYEVEVLVRSLVAAGESGFVRHPIRRLTVPVDTTRTGAPAVSGAPTIGEVDFTPASPSGLEEVPGDIAVPEGVEVIGGVQLADGSWEVVALVAGSDGVQRPVTLRP